MNLQGSLPAPVLGPNTLRLTFRATSPGITYRVETSRDLRNWITIGVTRTVPGPDQTSKSTATVIRDANQRFLRLKVSSRR